MRKVQVARRPGSLRVTGSPGFGNRPFWQQEENVVTQKDGLTVLGRGVSEDMKG